MKGWDGHVGWAEGGCVGFDVGGGGICVGSLVG